MDIRNILFLDIETISQHKSHEALNERLLKLWQHKASLLRIDKTAEELYFEKAGIYAEFGKVITIAVGYFKTDENHQTHLRVKAFSNHDEKTLLEEFQQLIIQLESQKALILCAHNGKEFDFPYLCRRMLINGIALPGAFNIRGKKPWEITHIDTLELWKFGDQKNFTSLDLMAACFNIPTSKEGIDGSQVNTVYYHENDLDRIAHYCKKDVVVLAQLFQALHQMPIIEDEFVSIL